MLDTTFNIANLIRECGECEDIDNCEDNEIINDLQDTIDGLDDLEDECTVTAESVAVFESNDVDCNYFIDAEDLARFMGADYQSDPLAALKTITDANGITVEETAVVFDTEMLASMINEAKATKGTHKKKKLVELKGATQLLKSLKNKGVKIKKKKPSKKKKK